MQADYSAVDRLLHRVALGSVATAEILHDIERTRHLKQAPPDNGDHVFITGLARAGTTILLREIHRTGHFASLTYADMPFVLAPNLWERAARSIRKPFDPVERAHGDGIAVNLESPEAFDEVFWRIFHGKSYIKPDGLYPHRPGPRAIARYREFLRLVMKRSGKARYLAKGNNNILRLGALAAAMPGSTFLLVVRDPLSHAVSLLSQHRRFIEDDPFRRNYMRWLGHHEFGVGHLPYRFPGAPEGDPATVDYWLATWLACYSALEPVLDAQPNIRVVPYERMCADPAVWTALCRLIGIDEAPRTEIAAPAETFGVDCDRALRAQAEALHARFIQRSRDWIG